MSVKLYWVTYGGDLKLYGVFQPGKRREQNSYQNNVWLITDLKEKPLGFFIVSAKPAQAIVPKLSGVQK